MVTKSALAGLGRKKLIIKMYNSFINCLCFLVMKLFIKARLSRFFSQCINFYLFYTQLSDARKEIIFWCTASLITRAF